MATIQKLFRAALSARLSFGKTTLGSEILWTKDDGTKDAGRKRLDERDSIPLNHSLFIEPGVEEEPQSGSKDPVGISAHPHW